MALVSEIVTRAFRKTGIAGAGDTLQAEELNEGVAALNAMVHGWRLRNVDLSWTDKAASDTFPLDQEYEEGIVYLLADRISPDYTIPPAFDADDWFRSIQVANITVPVATMPSAILETPTKYRRGWTRR